MLRVSNEYQAAKAPADPSSSTASSPVAKLRFVDGSLPATIKRLIKTHTTALEAGRPAAAANGRPERNAGGASGGAGSGGASNPPQSGMQQRRR